jgi:hypothetical protein
MAVFFAFRAYNTGTHGVCSKHDKSKDPKRGCDPIVELFFWGTANVLKELFCGIANAPIPRDGNVYQWIDLDFIAKNKDSNLVDVHRCLVDHINDSVLNINYSLNDKKANRVVKAYISTIFGIVILLILVILIGSTGIGLI